MEWFRWYGGTFGDPKLQWVARQSCHNVASVLAVWVAVLERAHNHEQRGCCEGLDFESMDVALGLDDGACSDIYQAMIRKGMIADGDMVASWDKRQPKAEDATATDRKRAQRDREKLHKENEQLRERLAAIQSQTLEPVTECHGMSHEVTTEESRREEKRETLKPQQQHAREQLTAVVEEYRENLVRLFPEIDLPVAIEKLLHHFRESPLLIDPWMTALKWFQREFKAPALPRGRERPDRAEQRNNILAKNAAACRRFVEEAADAGA